MEASSSSFSFSKEFLVHLLNQWEKLCMHVHVGTFVTDHLYHVKQQPFCHAAAWAWTLCPVLMLAADEVAIITNRKPFTLTILCRFLMTKMQLPKIRNGVLCHVTMIAYTCMEKVCCPWAWPIKSPRRGGGTPYNGLHGEGSPNGVPFSGFKYMKGYRGLTCWSIIIKGYWEIWYCGPWKDLKQVTFSGCKKDKKLSC